MGWAYNLAGSEGSRPLPEATCNRTIPIFTYADLQDKEDLPADYALVHKDAHFIPFWRKQWHSPAVARPWLEEESLAFAGPFRELASKLQCHLDVSTRAAGDCLAHGCLVLLGMSTASTQRGLEEEEEEEPLPLQAHVEVGLGLWCSLALVFNKFLPQMAFNIFDPL